MVITPLRCGVDSLEATFTGELPDELLKKLATLKLKAQATNEPQPLTVDGVEFFISPKGQGFWTYLLASEDLLIWLGTAPHIPPMKIRLLQQGLAEKGPFGLWEIVQQLAWGWGLFASNCTRVDVATDFQGWIPTSEEMSKVVCPASFRPVYPSYEKPETFQYGKGSCVLRVYDKSKEIVAHQKEWWRFVWRTCRGFDESQPVWRVEIQLRSDVLREIGCSSVPSVLDNINGLLEFGLEWCSLREPNEDSNPSRWPVHPAWGYLKRTYMPGIPLSRVKAAVGLADYDRSVKRFVAMAASVGATMGSEDYWHVCKSLSQSGETHIEHELETEFASLVERARRKRHL